MPEVNVLKTQQIVIALAAGGVVMIATVLTYLMIWRTRQVAEPGQPAPVLKGAEGVWKAMPWVLLLTYVASIAYATIQALALIKNPPNW